MEKSKLLPVIAAIMITSMAVSMLSISTTTVSATHTQGTPSLGASRVKANTSMVITITVTNNGPDPIDNVRIIIPTAIVAATPYPGIAAVSKLQTGDNVVLGDNGEVQGDVRTDNKVWIKAGTAVTLGPASLSVGAENVAKIPKGAVVRWTMQPSGLVENVVNLAENLSIKLMRSFFFTTTQDNLDNYVWASDDPYGVVLGDNIGGNNKRVVLVSDTLAARVSGTDNVYVLPENTMVTLLTSLVVKSEVRKDNKFTLQKENYVLLSADNMIDYADREEVGIAAGYENFWAAQTLVIGTKTIQVNDNIQIWDTALTENLVFPAGTPVRLENNVVMYLFANTQVMVRANESVVKDNTALTVDNQPGGWMQSDATAITTPSGSYLAWENAAGDNRIASGNSKSFPISLKTPNIAVENAYTIYVRTHDTNDDAWAFQQQTVTLTVDGAAPTYTVSVLGGSYDISPTWVKDNTAVTITITANESLAKLDNVRVTERDGATAADNVQVTMTPQDADNKIWTGTYTTGSDVWRDGVAKIYVMGAQIEDLVGNKGADNFDVKFRIDRSAPLKPRLDLITGWPADAATTAKAGTQTKTATWTLENNIYDNVENSLDPQAGMTVKVRVGTATTIYSVTTDASGYWTQQITLVEGTQEVGLQIIDKAGNAGLENAENIILDSTKPSITMTSPTSGGVTNDNTPTISLTISDATLGVENADFDQGDNSGYRVILRQDDNLNIAVLTPKNPTTIPNYWNSLTFENDWVVDNLADNWYNIVVVAGDNLQSDNLFVRFRIDTTKPATADIVFIGDYTTTTLIDPHVQKSTTLSLNGTIPAGDVGGVIKVYLDGVLATSVTTTTTAWSASVTLTAGTTQKVEVTFTDLASNESDKKLYGYVMADGTAPTVTISAVKVAGQALTAPYSTDKKSVEITGSVSKDTWEDYTDLTVRIQVGGAAPGTVTLGTDGSFTTSATLGEGSNVITITATDAATNVGSNSVSVECTVTPLTTYAIILVVVALILAAIAIFRKEMK